MSTGKYQRIDEFESIIKGEEIKINQNKVEQLHKIKKSIIIKYLNTITLEFITNKIAKAKYKNETHTILHRYQVWKSKQDEFGWDFDTRRDEVIKLPIASFLTQDELNHYNIKDGSQCVFDIITNMLPVAYRLYSEVEIGFSYREYDLRLYWDNSIFPDSL